MGITTAAVRFSGSAPSLPDICSAITDITSLPVVVIESSEDELCGLFADIAFQCAPEQTLEITVHRPGAVDRFCDESFEGPADAAFMKQFVTGANEPPGTQTVHLRGYVGEEPTLMFTTELALAALGGTPSSEIPAEERADFARPITEAQLADRHRRAQRQVRKGFWLIVLMLPVLIPLWLLGAIWFVVTMPVTIWRARRRLRAFESAYEASSGPPDA